MTRINVRILMSRRGCECF